MYSWTKVAYTMEFAYHTSRNIESEKRKCWLSVLFQHFIPFPKIFSRALGLFVRVALDGGGGGLTFTSYANFRLFKFFRK